MRHRHTPGAPRYSPLGLPLTPLFGLIGLCSPVQLYTLSANPDASREIAAAGAVIVWLKAHLQSHLPDAPTLLPPDSTRICIAGHSRGERRLMGWHLS